MSLIASFIIALVPSASLLNKDLLPDSFLKSDSFSSLVCLSFLGFIFSLISFISTSKSNVFLRCSIVFDIASSISIPAAIACFTILAIVSIILIPFLLIPSTSSIFILIPKILSIPFNAFAISSTLAFLIFILSVFLSFLVFVVSLFGTLFSPSPFLESPLTSLGLFS